jgi:hypothetical protein
MRYTTDDAIDAVRSFYVSENGMDRDEKPPIETFREEHVTVIEEGKHFRVRDVSEGVLFDVRRLAPTNIVTVTVIEWPSVPDMVGWSIALVKRDEELEKRKVKTPYAS